MTKNNERFNAEAAAWDSNPDVHRFSDGALSALLDQLPQLSGARTTPAPLDVLEIGCGTGLLSLRLAPFVRSILAIDAAPGMIAALQSKLSTLSPGAAGHNVTALCVLLEDPEDPALPEGEGGGAGQRRKFDLVTSHLVLHHIPDLAALLRTVHGCLRPGGEVALTDFEDFGPQARRFHPEAKIAGVERHGVDAEWFAGLMRAAGFVDVDVRAAWRMDKAVERVPGEWVDGKPEGEQLEMMEFPFLLCRGRKEG